MTVPDAASPWSLRDPRWSLVLAHIGVLAAAPTFVAVGVLGEPPTAPVAVAVAVGVAILIVQLRISLALATGRRPRRPVLLLVVLVVLVGAPLPWFGWPWIYMLSCVIASARLVLGFRAVAALGATLVAVLDVALVIDLWRQPFSEIAYWVLYVTFAVTVQAGVLWGSARLVAALVELRRARLELAELAVGRERLRVSRDMHDLLGQSLSAISLKGDLAVRLLTRDPPAARTEVRGLIAVARNALAGIRAVTRDEHAVSLQTEIDGAVSLLSAAHIVTTVDVDTTGLPSATESVLAWAVREAVTNVLRHSRASRCAIGIDREDGGIRLTVVNDGADSDGSRGGGLTGLAERVEAVAGTVTAGPDGRGGYLMRVELPREAP